MNDFRNITRGEQWLKSIVDALERMDHGEKDAMEKTVNTMLRKLERVPGEDDD